MKSLFFLMATVFYGLATLSVNFSIGMAFTLMSIGFIANIISIYVILYHSFPLVPLFQKSFFIPAILTLIFFISYIRKSEEKILNHKIFFIFIFIISVLFLFFPGGYYLPFLKTKSIFSHIYFYSLIIGNCLFITAGLSCIDQFIRKNNFKKYNISYISWGVFFLSISMFSGEIWSYLQTGSPIVWEDPCIFGYMAIWFYYVGFLHLYLVRRIGGKIRAYLLLLGLAMIFFLFILPETGRFSMPEVRLWLARY